MKIPVTPDALNRLRRLQDEKKFSDERFYPGAPTEKIRIECERRVNDFLADSISLLQTGTDKEALFTRARALRHTFDEEDTEEREKVDDCIGETMRVVGIEDWTEHV
jgi:hypothetical protein